MTFFDICMSFSGQFKTLKHPEVFQLESYCMKPSVVVYYCNIYTWFLEFSSLYSTSGVATIV